MGGGGPLRRKGQPTCVNAGLCCRAVPQEGAAQARCLAVQSHRRAALPQPVQHKQLLQSAATAHDQTGQQLSKVPRRPATPEQHLSNQAQRHGAKQHLSNPAKRHGAQQHLSKHHHYTPRSTGDRPLGCAACHCCHCSSHQVKQHTPSKSWLSLGIPRCESVWWLSPTGPLPAYMQPASTCIPMHAIEVARLQAARQRARTNTHMQEHSEIARAEDQQPLCALSRGRHVQSTEARQQHLCPCSVQRHLCPCCCAHAPVPMRCAIASAAAGVTKPVAHTVSQLRAASSHDESNRGCEQGSMDVFACA